MTTFPPTGQTRAPALGLFERRWASLASVDEPAGLFETPLVESAREACRIETPDTRDCYS